MHVTIDGFGGNPQLLASEDHVRDLLDRYPAQIGMTKIAPPFTYRYVGSKPLDWGISGFVLIAESHISIHTFPEYRHVWVDIFSCKGFDADRAIADMKEAFELAEIEVQVLERGLEYPHSVRASVPLMHREREEAAAAVRARPREEAVT